MRISIKKLKKIAEEIEDWALKDKVLELLDQKKIKEIVNLLVWIESKKQK